MNALEAKNKVEKMFSKFVVLKGYEYDDLFVFVLKRKDLSEEESKKLLIDPISVDSKTGGIMMFNPLTVGPKFREAFKGDPIEF